MNTEHQIDNPDAVDQLGKIFRKVNAAIERLTAGGARCDLEALARDSSKTRDASSQVNCWPRLACHLPLTVVQPISLILYINRTEKTIIGNIHIHT